MSVEVWTKQQLIDFVNEQYGPDAMDAMRTIDRWLDRKDGVAVYRNHDLGHPEVGASKIVSFGSKDAQVETRRPPKQLPDGIPAGAINWRYQLEAVHIDLVDFCPVCFTYADFPCRDMNPNRTGKVNQVDHNGRAATVARHFEAGDEVIDPALHAATKAREESGDYSA